MSAPGPAAPADAEVLGRGRKGGFGRRAGRTRDAAILKYRVVIPAGCVRGRFAISHRVTLFDLDRRYADVVRTDDLVTALREGVGQRAVASAGASS